MGGSTTTISYDYEDRITAIDYPGGGTNSFGYNGIDARTSKTDSTGSFSFKRDGASVTDDVLNDGAAEYTPGISENRSGTSKFYHGDRASTTTCITNIAEATTDSRQYDSFGLPTASGGSTPSIFGFCAGWGYEEDPDSSLKLLGHRFYDPSVGRFLSRDPAMEGANWYSYCGNNPLGYADPDGLQGRITITLPDDPSGLPPGWQEISHGGGLGYRRFLAPGGREGLEWHPGTPGLPRHRGADGWHKIRRDPRGRFKKERDQYPPGKQVEIDTDPIVDAPEPPSMWEYVNWRQVAVRTAIVVGIGGCVLIAVGSGGTATGLAAAGASRLLPALAGAG